MLSDNNSIEQKKILMNDFVYNLRDLLPTDVFTDLEVMSVLDGSPDRRYGLVKRALAEGNLIPIRRGVYAFGKRFQRQPLNLFELAQKIYPFSYVSLESALSFHGWIPEATYTVTSVSLKRSATFETPLGTFSYSRIPKLNFVEVLRVKEGNSIFLMASPVKALLDYVLVYKKEANEPFQLFESLRIDDKFFKDISFHSLTGIASAYGSVRIATFVKALKRTIQA